MCLKEEILVAGRLRDFLPFWVKIATDQWVLNIIQHVFSIELLHIFHFNGVWSTKPPLLGASILSGEVKGLLHKQAVVPVPLNQENEGYFSTYFLIPKEGWWINSEL